MNCTEGQGPAGPGTVPSLHHSKCPQLLSPLAWQYPCAPQPLLFGFTSMFVLLSCKFNCARIHTDMSNSSLNTLQSSRCFPATWAMGKEKQVPKPPLIGFGLGPICILCLDIQMYMCTDVRPHTDVQQAIELQPQERLRCTIAQQGQ